MEMRCCRIDRLFVELRDSQPANWIVRRGCFCSIPIEEIQRCDNKRIRSNAQTISIYDIVSLLLSPTTPFFVMIFLSLE